LAFISGQMWNSIRGPQYLMRARNGGIGFVYPSSQHQLIAETHIVLILYGCTTAGVIFLAKGIFLEIYADFRHFEEFFMDFSIF